MNDETTKELEDLSTLACSTDEVLRKRALVAMLARVIGRATQADHEWLIVEQERNAALEARQTETGSLPLETVLQCLEGVLNDMTRGGEVERNEARTFHGSACARLRSLAGSPEAKAGRVLTKEEFATMSEKAWSAYDDFDGGVTASFRATLRWLEREGYLSVRLPPHE